MLYLDDETRRRLRGTQDGWIEKRRPKAKPAQRRKLNRGKHKHLVERVAAFMSQEKADGRAPTLFTYEASIRHGIRAGLCLEGWGWADADQAAADVVATALRQAGAQRPTWAEGQPEYVQLGAGALIERTRCVTCKGTLPEGHRKFCSDVCNSVHHLRVYAMQAAQEAEAYDKAVRGWRLDHDRA